MPFVMQEDVRVLRDRFRALSKQIKKLEAERREIQGSMQDLCSHELICVDQKTGGYKYRICEICGYEEHRDNGYFKKLAIPAHVRQSDDWISLRSLDFEPQI